MRISVIGAGYVGLVTAVGLASNGHKVVVVDKDHIKVNLINQGKSPLNEEGLDSLLSHCIGITKNLKASAEFDEIVDTEISLICVGTPSNADGSINLSQIKDVAKIIGNTLRDKNDYHTVVTRSTIIPGTTTDIIIPILEKHSGKSSRGEFGVAYNPEFMQEGKAITAFFKPDRIIIGQSEHTTGDKVEEIYRNITAPVFRTSISTAEMIKYASNAFLATKISFINDIANICHKLGVDVYEVVSGLSFDYRIGESFLSAGIGFGGSCLPKDLRALYYTSFNKLHYPAPLLKAVLDVNEMQSLKILQVAEQKLGDLDGKNLCVLGLAFKPGTDDVRDAPAIRVIKLLLERGASVTAYDPAAIANAKSILPQEVKFCNSESEAIQDSDCVLIMTEWDQFRDETLYRDKMVIDGRRALDPRKARALCDYQGLCW